MVLVGNLRRANDKIDRVYSLFENRDAPFPKALIDGRNPGQAAARIQRTFKATFDTPAEQDYANIVDVETLTSRFWKDNDRHDLKKSLHNPNGEVLSLSFELADCTIYRWVSLS
jgi:hypothetical protein